MSLRMFVAAAAVVFCGFLSIAAAATIATDVTVVTAEVTTAGRAEHLTTIRQPEVTAHQTSHQQQHVTDHRVTDHPGHGDTATDHGQHNTDRHDPGGHGGHGGNGTGGHGEEHGHGCPPEGEEGVRYVVAKFDFEHVRFPMIVAVWILFVTYAKIGKMLLVSILSTMQNKSRAIAGRTARCRCKLRYASNFTTESCCFPARLSCWSLSADCRKRWPVFICRLQKTLALSPKFPKK